MENFNSLKEFVKQTRQRANQGYINEPKTPWAVYDSDVTSFDLSFAGVLEDYGDIKSFIEKEYSGKKGELVAIELGGPGNTLFGSFPEGYLARSAGFTLRDVKKGIENKEARLHHSVYEADILSKRIKPGDLAGFEVVRDWVKGNTKDGVDIIIERMMAGLNDKKSQDLFLLNVCRWYKLLNGEGCLIAEVPSFEYNEDTKIFWRNVEVIQNEGGFEKHHLLVRFRPYHSVLIKKLPGAPEDLKPILDREGII